jgi:hypothetical protein
MKLAGYVVCMIKKVNTYRIHVGKLERKSTLRKPKLRWENDSKADLKRDRMEWYGLD